jgi:hypothetical protein
MHPVLKKGLPFALIFVAGFLFHYFLAGTFFNNGVEQDKRTGASRQKGRRRPPGFWFNTDRTPDTGKESSPSDDAAEKIAALGYVDGSRKATRKRGAVVHDATLIQPGLNYFTSGHGPEAFLMNSSGEMLHRWKMRFDRAFPEADDSRRKALGSRYWRMVHLFENGDLLAIYEGVGLIKLDKHSNILWKYNGNAHHDLHVEPDGTLYVLTRIPRIVSAFNQKNPILEDFITVLDSGGQEKHRISILKALQSSIYAPALASKYKTNEVDIFHTNTVEVLDGSLSPKIPFLKKGNILVSICFLDMVAVIDAATEKVVWALSKMWTKQHAPVFLQNGEMIVYDNQGAIGKSRVLQIEPLSHRVVWSYENPEFYSEVLGFAQRLQNGNTLVSDSDDGRAFEVTPDKKIVWEFFNPHRAGSNREFVAVLPEMKRLPSDFPTHWIP